MQWNLAHRSRDTQEPTFVDVEAADSATAIQALRDRIPPDHVILYVREVFAPIEDLPKPPAATAAEDDI